jgi:mRNA-degrading endonuclease RelE of RelBE toxin-antitoxin system
LKTFDIHLTHSAVDDLNKISEKAKAKVIASIQKVSSNPFSEKLQIKKLKGFKPSIYRLRSGDHRVLYRVQENIIYIMRVLDRKDLERIIKRLKL